MIVASKVTVSLIIFIVACFFVDCHPYKKLQVQMATPTVLAKRTSQDSRGITPPTTTPPSTAPIVTSTVVAGVTITATSIVRESIAANLFPVKQYPSEPPCYSQFWNVFQSVAAVEEAAGNC